MSNFKILLEWTQLKSGWRNSRKRRISYRIVRCVGNFLRIEKKAITARNWEIECTGGEFANHYAMTVLSCIDMAVADRLGYWAECEKAKAMEKYFLMD